MTTLDWRLDLDAPPEQVWPVFADTDAFNRAAGLDFRFDRVDGVMRGSTRIAGITSTWTEEPFTWESPRRFVSRRVYDAGPIRQATATCSIEPTPNGSVVAYQVELQPRTPLLAMAVKALASVAIRPGLYRGLVAACDTVRGERLTLDPPPELTPSQRATLEQALEPIDPVVAAALTHRIEALPLPAQHQLRALAIAADEGLDPGHVLHECLLASTTGALTLEIQVLCPRCRGAHHRSTVIDPRVTDVHCPTCDIRYDGHLSENVEVVFRPGDGVRDAEVPLDCVFSPRKTPHVVSRVGIAARKTASWEATLEAGGYRLETPSGACWLVVDPSCDEDRVFVDLKPTGIRPTGLRVSPGRVRFTARNPTDEASTVAVVSRWRPRHALTAGELLAWPGVREVLPEGLTAGNELRIEHGVVLVIDGSPRAVQRARQLLESPVSEVVDSKRVVLVCPDVVTALDEAARIAQARDDLCVGVAQGSVVALGDGPAYAGPAVEAALGALRSAGRHGVAVHPDLAEAARVRLADRCSLVERGVLPPLLHPISAGSTSDGPTQIGPYEVLQSFSAGVFLVADDKDRRWVVKRRPSVDDPTFASRAHLAHTHRHRNLVEVFDWGEDDGHRYIVCARLVGSTLEDELKRRRRLPATELRPVLHGLVRAATALRDAGLAGRFEAQRVFLLAPPTDVPGGVVLLDHGLLDAPGPDGPRLDVYALGALAYRALSGTPAWRGAVLTEQALQRQGTPPDQLDFGRVPVPWVPLLTAALQLDPADRPEDATAFGGLLRALPS